jgi:hypothetical protein
MSSRSGKLLWIVLVPVLAYGVIKGVMYFNAKRSIDRLVDMAAGQVEISYDGIETEILQSVAVNGLRLSPIGADVELTVDRVRVFSDDPLFFLLSSDWRPGEGAPPGSLGFAVSGLRMPVDPGLLTAGMGQAPAASSADGGPCDNGLRVEAPLLEAMGIEQLALDADASYRIDKSAQTLDIGMHVDLHDIQTLDMDMRFSDVDSEALAQGVAPDFKLARVESAVSIAPAFGQRALEACAAGSGQTAEAWSQRLAEQALAGFELGGLELGRGLSEAVRSFYRDWGRIEIVAAPREPVGMLSLMFLPPDQLFDALSLRLSLNDRLVTDTSFTVTRPDGNALAALFGQREAQPAQEPAQAQRPQRIVVRREYEQIAVANLGNFLEHRVRIKPHGLPEREGVLKKIDNGIAEVEQTVHGGKYTAFVPVADIATIEALVQRQVTPER